MRKVFFIAICALLMTSTFCGADEIRSAPADSSCIKIASWNIRIFSNSRTDEELKMICHVAKNFDFFAVIELRHEAVLKRMIKMLKDEYGRDYGYELSPYVGNTRGFYMELSEEERGARELYAYVYDKKKIRCIKSGKLVDDSTFFRKPYYATFKAGAFDFTVIVIHVIWGNTVSARRKEIKRLAHVYRTLQDNSSENDILLMGDFNRDPSDDLAWGPLHALPGMIHLFDLPEKSMIWDSHLYDNCLFQSTYVRECTLDKGIIRFDETDFGNNDKAANKAVSDHRPAWALYRTDGPDDD